MSLYQTYSDGQLIDLLKKNSEEVFTEIYGRYWEKLFAIAYHYSQNKQLSEEVAQDVFMSLWDRRNSLEINDLKAYLATATKFAIFKQLVRAKRRRQLLEEGPTPVISLSEEANINARFLKEFVDGIIETLPEKCRIVYKFSREQAMKISEIAEAMNISHKTVESYLTKALKLLRSGLKHIRLWLFI